MLGSMQASGFVAPHRLCSRPAVAPFRAARRVHVQASAAPAAEDLGFQKMREGVKVAAAETILTPRFYTTDFDEMEEMFSLKKNPNLPMEELEAMLKEFK